MEDLGVTKRAYFDYEILETLEAGLALLGHEVKAGRRGNASIGGSFVIVKDNRAELVGADIPPYQPGNTPAGYDQHRSRRLLLNKAELKELLGKTHKTGLTIVPLKLYNKNRRIKLLIGLARHKKKHDKRESIKKRDVEREIGRNLKN